MGFRLFCLISFLCFLMISTAQARQDESIPDAMPPIDDGGYEIINFLLMGADTANPNNNGRTDALMVVSVNTTAGTTSFLSIPRDLWVYVPGHGMNKVNTAYATGMNASGDGVGLLRETLMYNLGLRIDHYARVDFASFRRLIDDLGGIDVSVDCAIEDWRLISPDLDPTVEENWEMFTLPVGVHTMDGDLALWYARSRRTSSDFDRGRRQQVIMRAIWHRIRSLNLWDQMTDVFPQAAELVMTDLTVEDIAGYLPLAASIDTSRIAAYTFRANIHVQYGQSADGQSILLPEREAIAALEHQMMLPPTESDLVREHASVEIVNASGVADFSQVAADRLAWEGFVPRISTEAAPYQQNTVIYDYTGQRKGSSLSALQAALRVSDENIIPQPDPNRIVDFRVVIGNAYYSCTYNVVQPGQ